MRTQKSSPSRIALAVAVLTSGSAFAANKVELSLDQLPFNTAGQMGVASAAGSGSVHPLNAMLGRGEAFAMRDEEKNLNGEIIERGQQMWNGVPVYGAEFVATRAADGRYTFVVGNLYQDLDRDVNSAKPRLSGEAARTAARTAIYGSDESFKAGQSGTHPNGADATGKAAQLYIYIDDRGYAHLVYRVTLELVTRAGRAPEQFVALVSATTGAILFKYDNIQTAEEAGSGPGGNARMGQIEHSSSGTGLAGATVVTENGTTCTLSNSATRVMDAGRSTNTSSTTPKSYSCTTAANRFTEATVNGAYGVLNDILFNGTKTVEMYKTWFNVAPHPHCSGALRQYGHYDSNLDNAFWTNCTMSYGDGNTFHPLVSMDVVAHEVSHGVTEARSNLQYSGQSGGLNESFSDIAGTAAIYYVGANVDWKIGSMIKKSSGQMRCMDNPGCDGASIKHVSNYTSSMDVHHSSGVYNHAFYLLATKAGWNVKKAFEVYFRANANYWTSTTSFAQAAEGICKAAKDLAYNEADVKASLTAIGTNPTSCTGGGGGGTDITLTNGTAVTGNFALQESKYFVLDVPAGATGLSFTSTGSNGDVDLYVKAGAKPSTTDNQCKSEGANSNETCNIATVTAGKYYVLVYGYAASTNVSVKGSYSTGGGGDTTPALSSGVAVSNLSVGTNGKLYYKITVPSGKTKLTVQTYSGTGDVDVYVKRGSKPTSITDYTAKGDGATTTETVTLNYPTAADYYILLNGASDGAGASGFTVKATIQ